MINERDIAEKFSAIWKQHFPLLTSNFIREFNETQIEIVNKSSIPINENVRNDLVSEVAFNLAEIITEKNITSEEYLSYHANFSELVKKIAKEMWRQGGFNDDDLLLNVFEIEETNKICSNIVEFIQIIKKDALHFKPKLRGYGFIPDLIADLSIDNILFEIKTVNRNFKSSDLKQLFIYLALQQVSGNTNWEYAGLYNPRKGTYCKFNIKNLIYRLSGGKTPNETFENLLNSLVRDIQIDSRF